MYGTVLVLLALLALLALQALLALLLYQHVILCYIVLYCIIRRPLWGHQAERLLVLCLCVRGAFEGLES